VEGTRKPRRIFTPQQKYEMLKEIERCLTLKEGLAKYDLNYSVYRRWKRQLEVGLNASLRNGRPVKPAEVRMLEAENRKLKEALLNQSLMIAELKKEMGLDSPLDGESGWWNPNGGKSLSSSGRSRRWGGR
jgi:transposase-like protein